MTIALTQQATLEHTQNHLHIDFKVPHKIISSAVLNGGFMFANHLLNMKVAKDSSANESPDITLSNYCSAAGWAGTAVGLMTAASMDSFRMAKEIVQGVEIIVLVTSGLSNARRVGDRAECRTITSNSEEVGTINIIVLTSAELTDAACVEAVLMITEAKAAALQEAEIVSPISNEIATGTGTDAVAVISGQGPETINYCGKHVLFGEILGRMVKGAVADSIAWEKPC